MENKQEVQKILEMTNLKKKYFQLSNIVDKLEALWLISQQKTLLFDLFCACFDDTMKGSLRLTETILQKLLQEICPYINDKKKLQQEEELKVYDKWIDIWFESYIQALIANKNAFHLNTNQAIHILLVQIRVQAIANLLAKIQLQDPEFKQKHFIWSFCSLMRFAKASGELKFDIDQQQLTSKSGIKLQLTQQQILNWLFNMDRSIQLEIFLAILDNKKIADPPNKFEFQMVLNFFKYGLRTSYPNYRKEYLNQMKWFFERVRNCYDKDLKLIDEGKKPKKQGIDELERFLNEGLSYLYSQLFPDVAFELAFPILDILKMLYTYFGTIKDIELRKGFFLGPVGFLSRLSFDAYSENNFEMLLTQMNSTWESARGLAFDLISMFPSSLPFFTEQKIQYLRQLGIDLIADPVIRWFENGAYLLSWLMKTFASRLFPNTSCPEINFLYDLFEKLTQRYKVFKDVFATNIDILQKNLIHGYISTFCVIMQRNQLERLPIKELNEFFTHLLELLREIMDFATQLSADNESTWILDDPKTSKENIEQKLQVDCRGHFYYKDKEQDQVIKNIGTILQGTTLIESLEGEDAQDNSPENILVVSFYLVTREAGQFFQQLAQLLDTFDKKQQNDQKLEQQSLDYIIPTESLKKIVYQFFHALLNIKHLGSIDRIAQGLNQVARVMSTAKFPQLPGLVNDLIDKLLDAFNQNALKNIFRRSAGLPHVVTCLLKAIPQSNRQSVVQKVIKSLFSFVNSQTLELQVHALNILKKLFSESQLRPDMEQFVGKGYITSIQCFAFDDWSVRNSALMLFSALSLRTIGRNTNSEKLSTRKNFIEFFIRSPELIQFFLEEIQKFLETLKEQKTPLYPSVYPITLLLSRLIPLDMKMQRTIDVEEEKNHKVDLELVNKMLPLLVECAKNKNYLGRLMVSKSILPFLSFEDIPNWASKQLDLIPTFEIASSNHNYTHGLLLICKQVMRDYFFIKEESRRFYEDNSIEAMNERELNFLSRLSQSYFLVEKIKCPPVQLTVYEIILIVLSGIDSKSLDLPKVDQYLEQFEKYAREQTDSSLKKDKFRISFDMSHSILRKKLISFQLKRTGLYTSQPNLRYHVEYANSVIQKYLNNPQLIEEDDLEILLHVFKKINFVVKKNTKINELDFQPLYQKIISLISLPQAGYPAFSLCINQLFRFFLNLQNQDCLKPFVKDLEQQLKVILKNHQQNSDLVKQIIKVFGLVIRFNDQSDLIFYKNLCEKYSNCENIDDQRIAVIKSITLCLNQLYQRFEQQKANKEIQAIQLNFYGIFLRLLQDEIPEIRQKISKFISKRNIQEKKASQLLNFEYLLSTFFEETLNLQKFDLKEAVLFLLNQIFLGEFLAIKKLNHIQKKIFAFEKGNKFNNDYKISLMSYQSLIKIITEENKTQVADIIKEYFIDHQKFDFIQLQIIDVQQYHLSFLQRDEYLFELLYQYLFLEGLKYKTGLIKEQSEIYRLVIDSASNFDKSLKIIGEL